MSETINNRRRPPFLIVGIVLGVMVVAALAFYLGGRFARNDGVESVETPVAAAKTPVVELTPTPIPVCDDTAVLESLDRVVLALQAEDAVQAQTELESTLTAYASLMNGSERGPVVVAGDAANSALANLISSGKMPKRGPKLTPEQVQLIIDWINQGALNN